MGSGQSSEVVSQDHDVRICIHEATKKNDAFTFSFYFDQLTSFDNDFFIWIISTAFFMKSINILNFLLKKNFIKTDTIEELFEEYLQNTYPSTQIINWIYHNFNSSEKLMQKLKPYLPSQELPPSPLPPLQELPLSPLPPLQDIQELPPLQDMQESLPLPPLQDMQPSPLPPLQDMQPSPQPQLQDIQELPPLQDIQELPQKDTIKKSKYYHLHDKDYEPIELNKDMIIFTELE
jgi:hypothetical protein